MLGGARHAKVEDVRDELLRPLARAMDLAYVMGRCVVAGVSSAAISACPSTAPMTLLKL